MRQISVEEASGDTIENKEVEFVERKGIGHPDSLIDGIVDRVALSSARSI